MKPAASLENRYRRLLALYPAGHRRQHQEEMLGVLMTGAHAGQRWPGPADAANLIWGAMLIRLRPARSGTAWPRWRDALAVLSVLLPLIVVTYSLLLDTSLLATLRVGSPGWDAIAHSDAGSLSGWMIVAVLVLLRLRHTAAMATTALLIWLAYSASPSLTWGSTGAAFLLSLALPGLEIAALLGSSGPQRAMEIMKWWHYALALAIPLGLAAVFEWVWLAHPAVADAILITACVVTLAGMALASSRSKRVATILAIPAYYLVTQFLVPTSAIAAPHRSTPGWGVPLRATLSILPLAVLLGAAIVVGVRGIRVRENPADRWKG